jgi:hypothetical protein
VYSYPIILGFFYSFFIASVINIVFFTALSAIIQLISFVGDCMTMNVLVHESSFCNSMLKPDYREENNSNDVMNALIRKEIFAYYLDGRYVVRIPFYLFLLLCSLHIVISLDKPSDQIITIAYGLTLLANTLNETYLAVLRCKRNHRIAIIREKYSNSDN